MRRRCAMTMALILLASTTALAAPIGAPQLAIDTTSASPNECQLVQRLFDFMLTEEAPERVIGDKAYDSDRLADELRR